MKTIEQQATGLVFELLANIQKKYKFGNEYIIKAAVCRGEEMR